MLDMKEVEKNSISRVFGTFYLAGNEIAIEVDYIQEVVTFPTKLMKMPLSPPYLIGIFNLRGAVISVISLHSLLNYEYPPNTEELKIAIISHHGGLIGVTCNDTGEIIRIRDNERNYFKYPDHSTLKIIKSAIKLNNGERIIQVLNPFELLNYENIPKVDHEIQNTSLLHKKHEQNGNMNNSMKKCISFTVGGSHLAFEITKIDELVRLPEIEKTNLISDMCIGVVMLRDQRIPIVDFSEYMGLGSKKDAKLRECNIIVMKLNENRFGLLIDQLESIVSYWNENLVPFTPFTEGNKKLFKGCIVRKEEEELILLDQEKVFSNEEILKITEGYSKLYNKRKSEKENKKTRKINLNITFKVSHMFAVNIQDVREIINYPKRIVNPPGSRTYVQGILNLRGEMLTIVNTRKLYKIEDKTDVELKNSKIIIIQKNDMKIGLLVDSIESILPVDENEKTILPNYILRNASKNFYEDIQEIISVNEKSDESIVMLNLHSVTQRLIKENVIFTEDGQKKNPN